MLVHGFEHILLNRERETLAQAFHPLLFFLFLIIASHLRFNV